jgi:dipeptidyl aminopeptidase/acylaminoacyl peptidase
MASKLSPILVLLSLLLPAAVAGQGGDPIREFLGETLYDEVRVSPDGRRVAFIARTNDFEADREDVAIWLADPGRPGSEPVRVTRQPGGYSSLQWSPDSRLLSFLWTDETTGASHLHTLDPTGGGEPRRLTDPGRFADGISLYDWLPDGSGVLFLAAEPDAAALARQRKLRELYGDVRRMPDLTLPKSALYRQPLAPGGTAARLAETPLEIPTALALSPDGWWAALNGYGLSELTDTGEVLLLPLGPQAQAPVRTKNLSWEESFAWVGSDLIVAAAGEEVDGRFAVTEAHLHRAGTGDGRLTPIAPDLPGSVIQMVPLGDGSLLVTTIVSTRMRVSRVEPATGKAALLHEHRGWIFTVSASRDGRRIAFVAGDPRRFSEIYVADGPEGIATARPLTRWNARLSAAPLPEIETVSWDNGEGDEVEGVLFWPPGRKGEKGLPLIVDLHGGPFGVARTEAVGLYGSYMSYPALLASRGFLVLNPNYRGSAGRGDAFTRAVQGGNCSRPARDVITGAESLIARGWADRNRTGIIGYSYGGLTTNCVITRTDLFRAAATGAGQWNALSLFTSRRGRSWSETFYGSKAPWEDLDLFWRESPLSGAGRMKTPTHAVAGQQDGGAPVQAEALYWSLTAAGVPVELLLFPGEGHIFHKPSHKATKIRAEIDWLEHYLLGKPRTAPIP